MVVVGGGGGGLDRSQVLCKALKKYACVCVCLGFCFLSVFGVCVVFLLNWPGTSTLAVFSSRVDVESGMPTAVKCRVREGESSYRLISKAESRVSPGRQESWRLACFLSLGSFASLA